MPNALFNKFFFIKRSQHPETEIATLTFIHKNTSIPVPKPYFSFSWRNEQYILMSRIKGTDLRTGSTADWDSMSTEIRDTIILELRSYFTQLHSIPREPPDARTIASVTGGPFPDHRIHWDDPCGPFTNVHHLHLQLRHLKPLEDPSIPESVCHLHSRAHRLVFTHNDLAGRNIMVAPDGSGVTAIVDWEQAAWLPEYWEWGLKNRAKEFLEPFVEEAEADRMLEREFGPPQVHALA